MITPEHAGRSYPATEPYQVSRVKIREFARAIGDDNPSYDGPHPIAPPTFAFVVASAAWDAMFDDPELGLALARTVHADQRFSFTRPLRAGDTVTGTLTIDRVRTRAEVDMITTRTEVATVEGEPVCTVTAQLLHHRPTGEVAA